MEKATLARKPEESASHAVSEPAVAGPRLSNISEAGAPAGMPYFLSYQAKLKVNKPGDIWEQEADRIADAVMRKEVPAASGGEDAPVPTPIGLAVREGLSSPGLPLDPGVRSFMEPRFGQDFSRVRVHPDAEQSVRAIQARAFTLGDDIVFGAREYNPHSTEGRRLLAHELTHVVQQAGSSSSGTSNVDPKIFRKFGYGDIQGAGDEAQAEAKEKHLSIDMVSVKTDMRRVDEIIKDIDKNQRAVRDAEIWDSDITSKYGNPSDTNIYTKSALEIFKDKLDVSNMSTSAFALQYHIVFSDYQRLKGEATVLLEAAGGDTTNPIGDVTSGFANMGAKSLRIGEDQAGLPRFRSARKDLNTAATKMFGPMETLRGAALNFQGHLYSLRAKAAAKKGADAAGKLTALRAEINGFAKGVGMTLKMALAVQGFLGGSSAVAKTIGDANAAGETASRKAVAEAIYGDVHKISGGQLGKVPIPGGSGMTVGTLAEGNPVEIVEGLVTIIGEQLNKEKIAQLQQTISNAAAEEKAFNAEAEAAAFAGDQATMEGAAATLQTLVTAYEAARLEMAAASDALMEELARNGERGKDQAIAVVFLTDADRFLAQVNNALALGRNQQGTAGRAAEGRKKLRGTTSTIEEEPDRKAQIYWRARKIQVPGWLYGTNDAYQLQRVDVTLSGGLDAAWDYDAITQGGVGSVEGTEGAQDAVAKRLELLNQAKAEVEKLQQSVQAVLGMLGPGLAP